MPGILVPFMKQIVRNLVFQTESLDGLTLRHGLRLIADKKPFEITTAIYTFIVFITVAKVIVFFISATSKLDAYRMN